MNTTIETAAGDEAWKKAADLRDLGTLTADWLEGRNSFHPGYEDGPDGETGPLVETLVALNRAGFVTDSSQPGHGPVEGYDGRMWLQRAYVAGFADLDTAASLETAFAGNQDLIFWVNAPGPAPRAPRIDRHFFPVTLRERDDTAETGLYDINTCAGLGPSRTDLKYLYRPVIGRAAYEQLREAWYVTIAEAKYSADGTLWPLLEQWAATKRDVR